MEVLKLPNNKDLYEKHKAQARERTRRYRARMREERIKHQKEQVARKLIQVQRNIKTSTLRPTEHKFPVFQFAEVKAEEVSDVQIIE